MWQFLQTYGIWILLGVFFLLMMRMYGSGIHGMGTRHYQHAEPVDSQRAESRYDGSANAQRAVPFHMGNADAQSDTFVRDIAPEDQGASRERYAKKHRSHGCC